MAGSSPAMTNVGLSLSCADRAVGRDAAAGRGNRQRVFRQEDSPAGGTKKVVEFVPRMLRNAKRCAADPGSMRYVPSWVPALRSSVTGRCFTSPVERRTASGTRNIRHRLPDGQITEFPVQPLRQKYFCFRQTQITSLIAAIPSRSEGRFAIVTDAGRDAVDVEVPITNGTDADGKDVWSRRPDAGVKLAEVIPLSDGGKQARSPRRARYKPLKPLRGDAGCFPV